ncbi:MAG TPA: glycosyltransferase family 2 protein [Thermoanaerobaculia bacterium]|nr:glycosyltransferase family 2 protein [Thermoanaerobaculia bacterium]
MKAIIQIPCFNEESTLPRTLADLPRQLPGFDRVEWLVIDDGSTDRTAEVARAHGVDHVVSLGHNQGLARAFVAGLVAAVERGADVIVNTDADNQYRGEDVARLVAPVVDGSADLVIGSRPISSIEHFSPVKRLLQRLGSRVVRGLSGTSIRDAPSGFRALSADAALRLNVFSSYTYTLETIIQAGHSGLRVLDVPIEVNAPTRESRLIRSIPSYLRHSLVALLGAYTIYRPTRLFGALATVLLIPAAALAGRYLVLVGMGQGGGHVQSVIASGVLAIAGLFMAAIGVVAHLLAINRRLLEEIRYLQRAQALRRRGGAERPPAPAIRGRAV